MNKIYWKRKQNEQFITGYATVSDEVYAYWNSMMSDDLQHDILQAALKAAQTSHKVQEELQKKIEEQIARERDFLKDFDYYMEKPDVSNGLESLVRLSRKRGYEISEESEEDTQQSKFLRVDGHEQQVSDLLLLEEIGDIPSLDDDDDYSCGSFTGSSTHTLLYNQQSLVGGIDEFESFLPPLPPEELESIITLPNGTEVELNKNKKAQWNKLPTDKQDNLKESPDDKVVKVLNQKAANARKYIITLSKNRELQLTASQRAQWNKLPTEERNNLKESPDDKVLQFLNQKVVNASKSIITLSDGTEVELNKNQRAQWNKLPTDKQDDLQKSSRREVLGFLQEKIVNASKSIITLSDGTEVELNKNQKAANASKFIITLLDRTKVELREYQRAQWNKLSIDEQEDLKKFQEEEVLKVLNQKAANASKSIITLLDGTEVELNKKQRAQWNKLTTEERNNLKQSQEKKVLEDLNQKAANARKFIIILLDRTEVELSQHQRAQWNKLSIDEQEDLKKSQEEEVLKALNKKAANASKSIITLSDGNQIKGGKKRCRDEMSTSVSCPEGTSIAFSSIIEDQGRSNS